MSLIILSILLSEVNTRAVSRGLNEFIGEFKLKAGDVISIGGGRL